ncbi:MAG: arylsulfatase [Cytophagales bacterium]|nr:arylsulfatase [Cytophagales bacterium]
MKNAIITLFFSATIVTSLSAQNADSKPNIVLVVMDNFGYGEVGCYGGGEIRGAATPKIDGLADEGFRLTNFNVEAECTPSRASLMTGRYGVRTRKIKGAEEGKNLRGLWYGITKWEVTIPEMLTDQGYATGMFGKWHLGDTEGRYPTDQGFDEWYGIPRSSDHAFWPDSDIYRRDFHPDIGLMHVMTAKRGEKPKELDVYNRAKRTTIDREITDKAIDFIKRKAKKKQPFFAYLPYTQTHEPVDPHPDFKGKTGNGKFADVLAQTDAYVGELLSTIDKLGIKDNTIFIFTSDNGREGVQRSFGHTGPWRRSMFSPYEGSLRVPFIIRYPGKVPERKVSNELFHLVDILPTFATWTGGKIPTDRTLDGKDQSAFLMGQSETSARESVMIYLGNVLFGVKWRNWKMLLREMEEGSYAIKEVAYPSIYNLLIDPKEEVPEFNYLSDTWVDYPLYQVVEDFEESLYNDQGTPRE